MSFLKFIYVKVYSFSCEVLWVSTNVLISCIHHYCVIQNGFTALKNAPCAVSLFKSLPSPILATTALLTVSIVVPFPEWHLIGIIQDVAFADGLPSLSIMFFRIIHTFLWLDSSFLIND